MPHRHRRRLDRPSSQSSRWRLLRKAWIGLNDTVNCTGIYKEITPALRCWIYPGQHGPLDVVHGIQNSCNVFFSEMGHRLSMDETGNDSPEFGIEKIRKYASMFGLDETSGIEIAEREPQMTTEKPEASSIGQGKNSYSNIQLSRYITAVANKGTVFKLSLLDKMTDSQGNLLKDFTPEVRSTIDVKDSTWNAVHTGMRRVISDGSARKIFSDLEVDIAGKTGTAEEIKNGHRVNHAFFVSFAPYQNPEIAADGEYPIRIFFLQRGDGGEKYLPVLLRIYRPELHSNNSALNSFEPKRSGTSLRTAQTKCCSPAKLPGCKALTDRRSGAPVKVT